MLQICAAGFVRLLYRHVDLPPQRRPVYVYGAMLLFSTVSSAGVMLLLAALLGRFGYGVVFVGVFVGLRSFVGGYHASTYKNCFLLSQTTFLLAFAGAVALAGRPLLQLALLLGAAAVIWTLAPIRNPQHPVDESRYAHSRKIGRALLAALVVAALTPVGSQVRPILSTSVAAVAALMIVCKYHERGVQHG